MDPSLSKGRSSSPKPAHRMFAGESLRTAAKRPKWRPKALWKQVQTEPPRQTNGKTNPATGPIIAPILKVNLAPLTRAGSRHSNNGLDASPVGKNFIEFSTAVTLARLGFVHTHSNSYPGTPWEDHPVPLSSCAAANESPLTARGVRRDRFDGTNAACSDFCLMPCWRDADEADQPPPDPGKASAVVSEASPVSSGEL